MLRSLLGGQRMRFGPDVDGRLRVEGTFDLRLAKREGDPAFGRLVAGTRFVLSEGQRFELPWSWAA